MFLLLKQQQGKVSILFSKEAAETLLALANLRVAVGELEGTWRPERLFKELPVLNPSPHPKEEGMWGDGREGGVLSRHPSSGT